MKSRQCRNVNFSRLSQVDLFKSQLLFLLVLAVHKERSRARLQTRLLSNPPDLDSKAWAANPYFHNSKDLKVKPNYILCLSLLISVTCLKPSKSYMFEKLYDKE